MDPAKRLTLVKALAVAKNFDDKLAQGSRDWFVEAVIKGFEAGNTDAQVEQKTKDRIAATKTLVAAEGDFALALTADGNVRYSKAFLKDKRRNRVEILYGLIGREPRLAEAGQLDYLRFLAKRRFRSVCRQNLWVNPNYQHYFHYPDDCPTNTTLEWRLNDDARATFWNLNTANPRTNLPYTLKAAGVADPVSAVKKVFVKKDVCTANLTDCAVVADITFLDALLEAKNPTTYLTALPPEYVRINHVDRSAFVDKGADPPNPVARLPVAMPPRDLQVGDQPYIYNHPLYKAFRPNGSWTGEFAFVYSAGDRNHKSKTGFFFGGHGKEGTLFQFYKDFVDKLSSDLAIARQLALVHLTFMRGGAAAIAPGTVITDIEDDVKIWDPLTRAFKPASRHRLLAYDAIAKARDFTKVPSKKTRRPKTVSAGFLVLHSKTEHVCYIVLDQPKNKGALKFKKSVADLPGPAREAKFAVKFLRLRPPDPGATNSEIYAMKEWGVAFENLATSTEEKWPFLEEVDGKLRWKELSTGKKKDPVDELFSAPFALFTRPGTDIRTYQPRVDFGAHRTSLASNGAF